MASSRERRSPLDEALIRKLRKEIRELKQTVDICRKEIEALVTPHQPRAPIVPQWTGKGTTGREPW